MVITVEVEMTMITVVVVVKALATQLEPPVQTGAEERKVDPEPAGNLHVVSVAENLNLLALKEDGSVMHRWLVREERERVLLTTTGVQRSEEGAIVTEMVRDRDLRRVMRWNVVIEEETCRPTVEVHNVNREGRRLLVDLSEEDKEDVFRSRECSRLQQQCLTESLLGVPVISHRDSAD